MRDGRSRGLLGLGLLLALATGVLLYGALTVAQGRPGASVPGTVAVVVARSDIPAQTELTVQSLESRAYPGELVPVGSAREVSALVGQRVTQAIPRGLPILGSHLVGGSGRQIAGTTVEPGTVLIAFPSSDALIATGLIQAGDRVDIHATLAVGAEPRATQSVIQNLLVVQIAGGTREQANRSLILVVDHQTSLVLKHLRDSGAIIDLAVRSPGEDGSVQTRVVDSGYIIQNFGFRP